MAMTRSDLAERVAKKSKMSALQAELVVETIFDCMKSVFLRGERVEVRGLGTFKVRKYKGYRGRNSKTGRSILVAPKRLPVVQSGPCSSRARGQTATVEKQKGHSYVRDGTLSTSLGRPTPRTQDTDRSSHRAVWPGCGTSSCTPTNRWLRLC